MNLKNTLLRISGAVQVLEEELPKKNKPESNDIGQLERVPEPVSITE